MVDHKSALEYAEQGKHRTAPGIRNLAAAYLEAIELLQAAEDWVPRDLKAGQRLREILGEETK